MNMLVAKANHIELNLGLKP